MMKQYNRIKSEHKDTILFFRLGDFYEMFFQDAASVSSILNLTLTKRNGIPMAGIPYHAAHAYIARLLKAGQKIAICEQVSEPGKGKGIVDRKVVQIITPGTTVEEDFLEKARNNYLASIAQTGETLSMSWTDISTGDFYVTKLDAQNIEQELRPIFLQIQPKEVIVQESLLENSSFLQQLLSDRNEVLVNRYPDWAFNTANAQERITGHFQVANLKAFGISDLDPILYSAGILFEYLEDTAQSTLGHIRDIRIYAKTEHTWLDEATIRNLEIIQNLQSGGKQFTLLSVLDHTCTAMGSRTLREWLIRPLSRKEDIVERHNKVDLLYRNQMALSDLRDQLKTILDIERLSARLAMDRAHAKDLLSIQSSIRKALEIDSLLAGWLGEDTVFSIPEETTKTLALAAERIEEGIHEEPSILLTEGRLIRNGYSQELDDLRQLKNHSKEILEKYITKEKQDSGIQNLKIKYNKILGYFIEITKTHIDKVPEHFIRRQSLVNSERYSTDKLSDIESEINSASEKILELEKKLFLEIRNNIKDAIPALQDISKDIAVLDCIQSYSYAATLYGFTKPNINTKRTIDIQNGRHPVVEANIAAGSFVPNSLSIGSRDRFFAFVTGPNMAGKSTFLRQNALIVLMAQTGSFVPADEANVFVVDKIFCRVGASDNIARGESTFLVEMNETAHILRSATEKSLIIMDEVGRGTSTVDGLSIAWAVSEYLLSNIRGITLFATHYHELTALKHSGAFNLSLQVDDEHGDIVFLKKIIEKPSDNSYGIHVAQLAGLPYPVIQRAKEIQKEVLLENTAKGISQSEQDQKSETQFNLFGEQDFILTDLLNFNIENSTPLEALNKIASWKKQLK